jgi:hypothetical protein
MPESFVHVTFTNDPRYPANCIQIMEGLLKRLALIPLLMSFALLVGVASAATITVSGNTTNVENTPGGWMFNRDASTSTPFTFTTSKASIGTGSLYVKPIGPNPSDKFIGEFFMLSALANVNSISYDFLLGAGRPATDGVQFYMNVYANFGASPANKFYDCRYNVFVNLGSDAAWTTVTFDPDNAYSVTTRTGAQASPFPCPAVPADMNLLSPGSTIRAISLNVGDTSVSDLGVNGYLDRVVVNQTSSLNTYNFDPDKDACKDGGWQTMTRPNGTTFKNQGDCVSYTNNGR